MPAVAGYWSYLWSTEGTPPETPEIQTHKIRVKVDLNWITSSSHPSWGHFLSSSFPFVASWL